MNTSRLSVLLSFALVALSSVAAVAGENVWTSNGPYGGMVEVLAIDPSSPQMVYAGTFGGGVSKSTNGGASWTAVNSGLTNTYVHALAIDPSNTYILYAGTSGGMFKSINGGGTWIAVNSGLTSWVVLSLVIDPSSPQTVYAGTDGGGVFKSTNGGTSWTAVNSGLTNTRVYALAKDPSSSQTVYAGTSGGGVFKSTNGGTSWTAVNSGLTNTNVRALAIDPSSPQTAYAGTSGGGMFKSTNGGTSWTAVNSGLTNTDVYALAIDPSSPQTVYVGTGGGVFKNTNGGTSWTAVNSGLTSTIVRALAIDPLSPQTVYAGTSGGGVFKSMNGGTSWMAVNSGLRSTNVYALAIDPLSPQTIYAGFGGVFKSTNGGSSWIAVNSGLTNISVYALAIDPSSPQTVYAGTWAGGVFKSANGGTSWTVVNSGLTNTRVYALAIDPSSPQTVYIGTFGGGVFKSLNGGTSWTAVNSGLINTDIQVLAIDPSSPQTVYIGTFGGGVFKSANGGTSWTAANSGLTSTVIFALAIDPSSPQTVYAGTDRGVFKSANGGTSWTAINTGLPNLIVLDLAINPLSPQTIYAGTNGGGVFAITGGTGTITEPRVQLSTASVNLGTVNVGSSETATFTVTNAGGGTLSMSSITATGPDASQFTVNPTSFTVNAGASQTVTVTFTPSSVGAKSAALSVAHNATGSPSSVALSGTGAQPPFVLNFSGKELRVVGESINAVRVPDDRQEFAPLFKNGKTVTGSIAYDTNQPDIDPDPKTGTYRIGALSVHIPEIGLSASRSSKSMQISAFNDTSNPDDQFFAYVSGVDNFLSNAGLPRPVSFDVTLFGNTSMLTDDRLPVRALNWTFGNLSFNFSASDGTRRQILMRFIPATAPDIGGGTQPPSAPAISTTTASLKMDSTKVGSSSQKTFVISNTGNASLSVTGITVTGADAAQFAVSPTTATIAAGGSRAITVTFAPTSAGDKVASLSIAHNATGSPSSVALAGKGVAAPPPSAPLRDVRVGDATAGPGATGVEVSIEVDDATGIAGMDLTLGYNADALTATQVRGTPLLASSGIILVPNLSTPGQVKVSLAGATGIPAGSGALVKVMFDVKASAAPGRYELSLTRVVFRNERAVPLTVGSRANGTFTVTRTGQTSPPPASGQNVRVGPGIITTFAGKGIANYSGDGGPANRASLAHPNGVAVDAKGNVYIADIDNDRIRRVGTDGIITTFAGGGGRSLRDRGPATLAGLQFPAHMAIDATGVVYIADIDNDRIRRVGTDGIITTFAGGGGSLGDREPATQARLSVPHGVAVDAQGNVYIAEVGNHRIRRVGTDGIITTIAGTGTRGFSGDGGPAAQARLDYPGGVAVDAKGAVYIADTDNHRIRRVGTDGIITTIAGTGTRGFSGDEGPAVQARLDSPFGAAVDAQGNVYIADFGNHRIRRVGTDGIIKTLAGSGKYDGFSGDGGPAVQAQLAYPRGVAVDANGVVYIADTSNDRIRRVGTDGTITTFAGTGTQDFGDGGPAILAQLNLPYGVAVDAKGNVYSTDYGNGLIRQVGTDGIVTTIAGTGTRDFSGDEGPANKAQLDSPGGLAVDAKGVVYIADYLNHRIRRVGPDGIITTFAGSGATGLAGGGFSGDGGPANMARLGFPIGLAVDAKGVVYIAEFGNSRVRRVGTDGIITTFAGTGTAGFSGDGGPAVQAQLNNPNGLAVDARGNLYIADTNNRRIRWVGTDGVITTMAGTGTSGFSGDGGPATLAQVNFPVGVAVDAQGNVYIGDVNNHRVRRVGTDGVITTMAGTGTSGFSGDGGPATLAQVNGPYGVAVDAQGNVYIADFGNHRIRRVEAGAFTEMSGLASDFNGDGKVDFDDFFLFASAFGQKAMEANVRFDLDKDGDIGFGDFFIFAGDFGKTTKAGKLAKLDRQ